MSRSKKMKQAFGSTGPAVMLNRRKMLAFLKDIGFDFPNQPTNKVLLQAARQHGYIGSKGRIIKPKTAKPSVDFYASREWKALRYDALKANDGRCELCGASKHDGAQLHVDHIMPRSKFPALELERTNLQILCSECNLGKGNRCTRDWRQDEPMPEPSFEHRILLGD